MNQLKRIYDDMQCSFFPVVSWLPSILMTQKQEPLTPHSNQLNKKKFKKKSSTDKEKLTALRA